jgi:hypothetical protein
MPTRPPRAHANRRKPGPMPRLRGSPHQALYNTTRWKQTSKAYRALHPRCECDEHRGKPDAPRSECVDHIERHGGDVRKFFDPSNLRALAWSCHSRVTAMYDTGFGNPARKGKR